jgi:hypothetical protein
MSLWTTRFRTMIQLTQQLLAAKSRRGSPTVADNVQLRHQKIASVAFFGIKD